MHETHDQAAGASLLTLTEAAKRCGLSVSTLLRAEARGEITPLRTPGGHRRFTPESVDALMRTAS